MLEVKVLGPGCAKCQKLFEETQKATAEAGVMANLVKVEGMPEIIAHGVILTPALVIDGVVKCSGKMPSVAEITAWLLEASAEE